ncbi:MAG: ATP-binding protein [Saprospiraceae bacterium]|nr:ATP-binding protein [Saprospiraceae bacterium]
MFYSNRKKSEFHHLSLFVFLLWTTSLLAQDELSYSFSFLSQKDGLSSDFVLSFLEDHQGFMWIGNENGINRYDGYQFSEFKDNPARPSSLKGNFVREMIEDRNKDIWICTDNALNLLRRKTGAFETIPIEESFEVSKGISINQLLEDHQGNIWAGSVADGVLKISPSGQSTDFKIERFYHDPHLKNSLPKGIIRGILKDKNNHIWIAVNLSICLYKEEDSSFEIFDLSSFLAPSEPLSYIENFAFDEEGGLIIGTYENGVFHWKNAQNREEPIQIKRYLHQTTKTSTAYLINDIISSPDGMVWISTDKGIIRLDIDQEEFKFVRGLKGIKTSSPNRLTEMFFDSSGKLWIATSGDGVIIIDTTLPVFDYYGYEASDASTLSFPQVRTLLIDQNRNLWVGTLGGGLDRFRLSPSRRWVKVKNYSHEANNENSLVGNSVIKIIEDRKGYIWIATNGSGLSKLNPETEQFTSFLHDSDFPEGTISDNRIWALCEDNDGYIWAGSFEFGLNKIDSEKGSIQHYTADASTGLRSNLIRTIYKDSKGTIWVGSERGLYKYDKINDQFIGYFYSPTNPVSLSTNWVWAIFEDSNEDLWVGTNLGLNKLDRETGNVLHYYEQDGLPSNSIYGILEDEKAQLWISTDAGLVRFIKDIEKQRELGIESPFRKYYSDEGLKGDAFLPHSFFNDKRTGHLYFGGTHGFNIIKPKEISFDTSQVRISLSSFSKFDISSSLNVPMEDPFIASRESIQLSPTENVFSFSFTDFLSNKNIGNKYEYLLEGLSNQWIPLNGEKNMTFIQVSPGYYNLKIRGVNMDGYQIKEQQLIGISIQSPWWKSNWAIIFYIFLFLALLIFFRQSELHRSSLRQEAAIERARAEEKASQAETVAKQAKQLQESLDSLKIKNQEIIETQNQLILKEKMASLGQITAGIAHEIKNPLNFVTNFAEGSVELIEDVEMLLSKEQDHISTNLKKQLLELIEELKQNANDIHNNGNRADRIVKSMMQHARGRNDQKSISSINEIIEENINLAYHGYRATVPSFHVQIEKHLNPDLPPIKVVQQDIGRVLLNLLNNACYAVHKRLTIESVDYSPKIIIRSELDDRCIKITVHDNGAGIPPKVKEKIFTPFFTTKPTGTGNTGLGLSISYDLIVKGHNGRLEVESEAKQYTIFYIFLPI